MPPLIYSKDEETFLKPFQYLHPGIRKASVPEQIYQPPVFQQSVTLTARMWDENDSKGKMDWSFDNLGVLSKYSPLFIGLVCGFGVVLLIMSTVMLWRYCVISASNKLCCKGVYGEMTTHQQKSLPIRKETNQNGFENFERKPTTETIRSYSTLRRSATMGSMSMHNLGKSSEPEGKLLHQGVSVNNIIQHLQPESRLECSHYAEPCLSPDQYASHSYLQMPPTSPSDSKNLSRSTPGIEDLYAKVNFSKKRKNRMRRDEAAIIAISKSHSSQNNNSLDSFGSAVVVYNERTAL